MQWFSQALRFSVAGLLGVTTFFVVYWILTRWVGLWYIVAVTIAFLVQLAINFTIQKNWAFKSKSQQGAKQFKYFFALHLTNYALNTSILFVMVEVFHWNDLVVQALSTFFLSVFSFFRSRIIFKD